MIRRRLFRVAYSLLPLVYSDNSRCDADALTDSFTATQELFGRPSCFDCTHRSVLPTARNDVKANLPDSRLHLLHDQESTSRMCNDVLPTLESRQSLMGVTVQ